MKIPRKIKDYKVIVDNSHKYFGTTNDKNKTVIINKTKSLKAGGIPELKDTIAHEKLHVLHPDMTEKGVEKNLKHKDESVVDKKNLAIKGLI